MCGETRIPRDMCAGNTLPGETYITVTPALTTKTLIKPQCPISRYLRTLRLNRVLNALGSSFEKSSNPPHPEELNLTNYIILTIYNRGREPQLLRDHERNRHIFNSHTKQATCKGSGDKSQGDD